MKKKILIILGDIHFTEENGKPILAEITKVTDTLILGADIAESVGESLVLQNVCDAYLIPSKYKGEIIFNEFEHPTNITVVNFGTRKDKLTPNLFLYEYNSEVYVVAVTDEGDPIAPDEIVEKYVA